MHECPAMYAIPLSRAKTPETSLTKSLSQTVISWRYAIRPTYAHSHALQLGTHTRPPHAATEVITHHPRNEQQSPVLFRHDHSTLSKPQLSLHLNNKIQSSHLNRNLPFISGWTWLVTSEGSRDPSPRPSASLVHGDVRMLWCGA